MQKIYTRSEYYQHLSQVFIICLISLIILVSISSFWEDQWTIEWTIEVVIFECIIFGIFPIFGMIKYFYLAKKHKHIKEKLLWTSQTLQALVTQNRMTKSKSSFSEKFSFFLNIIQEIFLNKQKNTHNEIDTSKEKYHFIRCSYTDEQGKTWKFMTDGIKQDLPVGEKLTVYVQPNNWSNYWVDIDRYS